MIRYSFQYWSIHSDEILSYIDKEDEDGEGVERSVSSIVQTAI